MSGTEIPELGALTAHIVALQKRSTETSIQLQQSLAIQQLWPDAWAGGAIVDTWWRIENHANPMGGKRLQLSDMVFKVRGGYHKTIETWRGDEVPECLITDKVRARIKAGC